MEEDIKFIEEMKFWEGCETTIDEKWCKALENLLTRYKEYEEAINNFMNAKAYSTAQLEDIKNRHIPKSKVKEQIRIYKLSIDSLKNDNGIGAEGVIKNLEKKIEALEELLKEKQGRGE